MFYKQNFISKEEKDLFETEASLEFALAMKKHFINENIQIKSVFCKNNTKDKILKYIPVFNEEYTISISGYSSIGNFYLKNLEMQYKDYTDFSIQDVPFDLKIKNKDYYERAQKMIEGFHKLEESIIINDKNGKKYKIEIHSNTDSCLDQFLTQDVLSLYDLETNNKIGYIKSKYSTRELYDFYFPTAIHEFLNSVNKDYLIEDCQSKEDILNVLKEQSYIKDFDKNNIDSEYKKIEKKLFNRNKEYIKDSRTRWINVATTEYSRLISDDNVNYQGKGLAQTMYFYMAKHFTSKGITFRSSTMLNDKSQNVWNNLIKNFPNNVSTSTLNNEKIYQFKVNSSEIVDFENGTLQHKTEISDFLDNKLINRKINKAKP